MSRFCEVRLPRRYTAAMTPNPGHLDAGQLDAAVVGAGPNGLSAAITLARAGLRVRVLEAHSQPGGGLSSSNWQGFTFDTGSALHPLGYASPAWQEWPLHAFGLDWVRSPAPYAHLWWDGRALALPQELDAAAQMLGPDGGRWRGLFGPLVTAQAELLEDTLRPLLRLPRHPLTLARFGVPALAPAPLTAELLFQTPEARALWAGLAAHVNLPMTTPGVGAAALMLGTAAHAGGWPFPRGGAQALTGALAEYFRWLGGEIQLNTPVRTRADLPAARVVLVDSSPAVARRLLRRSTPAYDAWLARFRYGLGAVKLDYALSGPVPWLDPAAAQAATLHIGGGLREIERAERGAAQGRLAQRPYLLAAQHTLFDPGRAPQGGHTFWVYAHAPAGTGPEYADTIEAALEQLAPGFRGRVLHRRVTTPAELEAFSPVFGGGDVNGGRFDLPGLLARPVPTPTPYRTPDPQVYLCSSATPPGGGVHGMCGYHAAQAVLHDLFA